MLKSPFHRYKIFNNISSWLVFAISLAFYWLTTDPDASYWDCPEYVTVASKMEVGHPPGNPIWMLAMRVATIPFSPASHALVINLWSGIFMAFASFFLCRLIFIQARVYLQRFVASKTLDTKKADWICVLISIGASLCFALCDSTWFSAVEAEVYAMSTFLSAVSLWIIYKWWWEPSKGRQHQLLILLAYIMGISLGVHQLNLLLIPVYAIIILFKHYRKRINPVYVLIVFLGGVLLIGVILMGIMPASLFGAGKFELWSVNALGLDYNAGVKLFGVVILLLFCIFLYLLFTFKSPTKKGEKIVANLQLVLWSGVFILIGFSSFVMIMIRAQASPMMNESTPNNIFALESYISRDQYGSTPLLYGYTFYSAPMLQEEIKDGEPTYQRYALKKGRPQYIPATSDAQLNYRSGFVTKEDSASNRRVLAKGKGYVLADYYYTQRLTPELEMWLPRITSLNALDRKPYENWAGATEETMDYIPVSEVYDTAGNPVNKLLKSGQRETAYSYRPTYMQNLRFFVAYQSFYMYFRYLFWNFIGRQNDFMSTGEIEHGNLYTGIPFIDAGMLGITDEMPEEIGSANKGRNYYFGIPFLLGLAGIVFLFCGTRKSRRLLTVIFSIFLMTGLAIVMYLNQSPAEPRERDYTFLVSYMAFTMWIAAGMISLTPLLVNKLKGIYLLIITGIVAIGTPTLMAVENFDDHDRRGRFETTYYASSLLDYEHPAIIFTSGDNTSFPVWYATEVLEMGKQHTPVDISYLNLPDYIENMKKQGERSLFTIGTTAQLSYGKFLFSQIPFDGFSNKMPLSQALKELYNSEDATWPTSKVVIKDSYGNDITINLFDITKGSSFMEFRELMLLDILSAESESKHPRHLFFPSNLERRFYSSLDTLLKPALFGKIYGVGLNEQAVGKLLRTSIERELYKISARGSFTDYYKDPLIQARTKRYRGEMVIGANEMLERGDTVIARKVADTILKYLPYDVLSPGNFEMSDSIYYEGEEFSKMLRRIAATDKQSRYIKAADDLDLLIETQKQQWARYYNSLTPLQQNAVSNESIRIFLKEEKDNSQ